MPVMPIFRSLFITVNRVYGKTPVSLDERESYHALLEHPNVKVRLINLLINAREAGLLSFYCI